MGTGEKVVERITINEESGTVTYNKCDASGRPGNLERVLAIHTPLRLEFYERSAISGLRLDWKAPLGMARDTFSNLVQLAKKIESNSSDVVGCGLASKPVTSVNQDSVWRAMLYVMRNPYEGGLLEKAGSPTVTDNIRVI